MEASERVRDGELWKMFEREKKQFAQMLDKLHNKELNNSQSLVKYYLTDKFKENEMGRACGILKSKNNSNQNFGW
jgi:hypothetical protein